VTPLPPDFLRAFPAAWVAGDADTLAAMLAPEAAMLTLTGLWAEGSKAIIAAMEAERGGVLARARLVTGRGTCHTPLPGMAILSQRLVVSGLTDSNGQDIGRQGAMLTATLLAGPDGWRAQAVTFAPVA
jgi:hypothetical protein